MLIDYSWFLDLNVWLAFSLLFTVVPWMMHEYKVLMVVGGGYAEFMGKKSIAQKAVKSELPIKCRRYNRNYDKH